MSQHFEFTGEIEARIDVVFLVVADVMSYPDFLPNISAVKRFGNIIEMTVRLGTTAITWKSKVTLIPDKAIIFTLVEGPFKKLEGQWLFTEDGPVTRVKYTTDFELALDTPGINTLAIITIEKYAHTIIDAFNRRVTMMMQTLFGIPLLSLHGGVIRFMKEERRDKTCL